MAVNLAERIVHLDDRLVVIDKPSGLPSVTAPGEARSLHGLLEDHLGARAWIVHRLDRGTSGLMVFARQREAHRALSALFETRAVSKEYLAAVLGHLDALQGVVDAPLRSFGSGRVAVDARGRPARTAYQVVERLEGADLVRLTPETGRRHQIRVHCYSLGHPVLGDGRYGAPRPVGGASRLMLHAEGLRLPGWAEDGADLVLRCPPGADFADELRHWRKVGMNEP